MANLSEDIQCAGSDTRPPMLDKADFASWQQRIRLYCRGKDNGINILKSIDEGPFQMGTTREIIDEGTEGPINLGPERPRVYSELSQEEKDRYNADIRATNIILQGSELTKEDRESQLYDDFEHFRQNKGETIHSYYVRFAKLINDMRNIKMTMSKIQLNSKFVITSTGMGILSFQSSSKSTNTYHQPHSADTSQSDLGLSPTDNLIENLTNTLALLTQSYKTFLPQINNQLRTSSNPINQATIQDGKVVVQNVQGRQNRGQGNNVRGAGVVGYGRAQNRVGNANPGQARQVKCYNCNGNGVVLDEEHLLFLAGGQDNATDEDVDEQHVQDLALNVDNVF
ncbi:hypothetical protein Tco_0278369 [Tanacetum coccineum]